LPQDPENNILAGMSDEQRQTFRRQSVSMVLATDNASHFEHLEQFEVLLNSCSNAVGIDNQVVMNLLLHACDVANTTKVR
jgi:hypothetical protein